MQRTWTGRVFIGVSLDGMIARPDHEIGWLTDPPFDPHHVPGHEGPTSPPGYEAFMAATDCLVMGRLTYEKILTFGEWPYSEKDVIVLSGTLDDVADKPVVVSRSIEDTVRLLNERRAQGVYVDGGQVVQAFLRHGLIDELTISTAPVLIGQGIPLFGALTHDVRLTHLGTSSNNAGMVSTRYAVNRES